MTGARIAVTAVASGVGFLVGFYAGIFGLLSTVGLDRFEGWQFPIATVPAGGLLSAVSATLASGLARRVWGSALIGSLTGAAVITVGLLVFDGDFGVAIGLGGIVVVTTTTVAVTRSARASAGPAVG